MSPGLLAALVGAALVALAGAGWALYALGRRRGRDDLVVGLSRELATAEERLSTAARGEEAQRAQDKAERLARGRMLSRAARRLRERRRDR